MKTKCFRPALTAIICAFAAATAKSENRLWSPADESNVNLADGNNWNPAFDLTGETPDDISSDVLAINSTTNATLAADFSTKTLYIGKGSILNNGNFEQNASYDRGAKLDVSAGTLTLTDTLWVGGGFADYRDCILNLSGGGRIVANYLQTGDCASRTDDASHTNIRYDDGNGDNMKANYINVDTGTEIDVTASANLSTYSGGTTFVNVKGKLNTTNDFNVANGGKAYVQIDGGAMSVGGNLRVGQSNTGTLSVTNGTVTTRWMEIGSNNKGDGIVDIMEDATLAVTENLTMAYASGSSGTLNLNGGTISLKSGENFKDLYVSRSGSAVFNQTSGTLEVGAIRVGAGATWGAGAETSDGMWNFSGGMVSGNNSEVNIGMSSNAAKGTLNVTAGTLDLSGRTVCFGREGGKGYFNLTGGSFIGGTLGIGAKTSSSDGVRATDNTDAYGEMNISGDGTATISDFNIGCNWDWDFGATGVVNQAGGTVTATNMRFCQGKAPSKAVYNLTGGELNVTSYIAVGHRADADSVGNYSEFNLKGGTLAAPYISSQSNADYDSQVTRRFVFNGGTLKPTTSSYSFIAENITCVHAFGGVKVDTAGNNIRITNDLVAEGKAGEIVKTGAGNLDLFGASTVGKGIKVEAGQLAFAENKLASNTELTPAKEVVVASGATLDLGGATVYTLSYSVNGVEQGVGTYENAHGGSVVVIASSDALLAMWTNASGDGDTANSDNWECYAANGAYIWDALPSASTTIMIPYADSLVIDFSEVAAADKIVVIPEATDVSLRDYGATGTENTLNAMTLAVSGSVKIFNGLNATLRTAEAWYDPSDAATLTTSEINGTNFVTAIANKGYRSAEMDALAVNTESVPYVADEHAINDNAVLVFGETENVIDGAAKGCQGFKAAGTIPSAVDQQRAIFSVAWVPRTQRHDGSDDHSCIWMAELRDTSDAGYFILHKLDWNMWGLRAEASLMVTDGSDPVTAICGEGDAVWGAGNTGTKPNAESDEVYVYGARLKDGTFVNTGDRNNNVTDGGAAATYHSLTASSSGEVSLWYGQNHDNSWSTDGAYIGETLVFVNDLTDGEYNLVRQYLKGKWLTGSGDVPSVATTLGSLILKDDATVDFDGANVAITNLYGSGTISNGTVTAIGTLNVVVNSDGTATKVVFPAGTSLTGGLTVSVAGLKNLTSASGHLVIAEAQTGDLAIEGNIVVVSADDADVKYYRVKLEDGKLVLYRNAGFSVRIR